MKSFTVDGRCVVRLGCLCVLLIAATVRGEAVNASYAAGETEIAKLDPGVQFYRNRPMSFAQLPAAFHNLSFTRRDVGTPEAVTLDIPANVPAYLILADNSSNSEKAAKANGFETVGTERLTGDGRNWGYTFFSRPGGEALHLHVPCRLVNQVVVAADELTLNTSSGDSSGDKPHKPAKSANDKPDALTADTVNTKPVHGQPAVDVKLRQTSINALAVIEPGNGDIALGESMETILTITPDDSASHRTAVRFVTPVGSQMKLARDEAERYVGVSYPNWHATDAGISFEDKYDAHDGGSIGAAVAVLLRSAIEGIKIDPAVAMTGDVSANGKVRAIGEVAAKLRGAAAGHCTIVVLPTDNADQLTDAVLFAGPTIATDVQVLGAATVDDALAFVRTDRDPKLADALTRFAAIAAAVKKSPTTYLKSPEAITQLNEVLNLAPNHLSAKCLLAVANGSAPKTLSIGASRYYTFAAAARMFTAINDRSQVAGHHVPSSVIRIGLADLHKLRPLADPSTRPLIDDYAAFVNAATAYVDHAGSQSEMEQDRQTLLDELSKEQADAATMQKVMKQGI